jgi:hypothetical protein
MKFAIVVIGILSLAVCARAGDLANQAPPKPPSVAPPNVPDPTRQGGDTIATAFPIAALPYFDTGTTTGYTDDYDEMCPYGGWGPDVVYSYRPAVDEAITVDLCGSDYDSKLEIYDDALHFVACNDDFYFEGPCGVYTSKIMRANLTANRTYYIVVDGYASAHGDYVLAVTIFEPCIVDCPAGGIPEGEPPLHDEYVDLWNGGCFAPGAPMQAVVGDGQGDAVLCGVSGWYVVGWTATRDADWFTLVMGSTGMIEVTADAEYGTYLFELLPQDCAEVDVVQRIETECHQQVTMTITGYDPGAVVWFWVAPMTFSPPNWAGDDHDYNYALWFSGLEAGVATEPTTWSALKALYD